MISQSVGLDSGDRYMKKLLVWDFDNTIARRKGGMWAKTLSEIAEDETGTIVDPKEFAPFLQIGFPWHDWQQPHTNIKTADQWWIELRPLFESAFERCSLPGSLASRVREYYADPSKWELVAFAGEVLSSFHEDGYPQVILSNHVPELENMVSSLGIGDCFAAIYNSAILGFEKPHPEIFKIVKKSFAETEDIWIIGDSLSADIAGGKKAGFNTCWFNPDGKEPGNNGQIDVTIYLLSELRTAIGKRLKRCSSDSDRNRNSPNSQ